MTQPTTTDRHDEILDTAIRALRLKVAAARAGKTTGSITVELYVADGSLNGRPKVHTTEAVK